MIKIEKAHKTLNDIGKSWYNFDFQFEKSIYCYLCCIHMKRASVKNLDEKFRFDTYKQWRQYICGKYESFSCDKLTEFSRYINQIKRNIKPSNEYMKLITPVIITLVATTCANILYGLNFGSLKLSILSVAICILLVLFIAYTICIFLKDTFRPIYENDLEINLLNDYKEIIDCIIEERANI